MSDNASPLPRDVVLGFDAAWGFSRQDPTSPALAGAAGALVDVTKSDEPVTELRIHGVSGSDGPTMLEHPAALQVAGNDVAGFYRRWSPDGSGRPSVPWKLEAYSWGGLTEAPMASASWLLLAPFMMYNVAYFMLPPAVPSGDDGAAGSGVARPAHQARSHMLAAALLRLLALAATVQFVAAAATVTLSTVAWQAAARRGLLPSWMGWYESWPVGWRIAVALVAVVGIVAFVWWVSVKTASKYEKRTSNADPDWSPHWPLTERGFWRGESLVGRQRTLHVAAGLAAAALIVGLSAGAAAARWAVAILAAAVVVAVIVLTVRPMADRHEVSIVGGGGPLQGRDKAMSRGVLAAAVVALVAAAITVIVTAPKPGHRPGALPGLDDFLLGLLCAQFVLLAALAVTVRAAATRARAAGSYEDVPPYFGGSLASVMAALGFVLGGLLTAVIDIGVTRMLGTPSPSGPPLHGAPPDMLAVPWPAFALGAAPVGMLVGGIVAGILLFITYRRSGKHFSTAPDQGRSEVAEAYRTATAGPARQAAGDDHVYDKNRRRIGNAWSLGLLADHAASATAWLVGGGVLAVLAAEITAAVAVGPAHHPGFRSGWWQGLASVVALVVVLVSGILVGLLRADYASPARRKTVGALWDVATFWPRAVHPLAPPCYAERAVPEVVDRIRLLTGHLPDDPEDLACLLAEAMQPDLAYTRGLTVPPGPVLLTGYSQGSIIAPAVIAQLPAEVREHVALLTLACPARRLYGRAFPAYFGGRQLGELRKMLSPPMAPDEAAGLGAPAGRWKNLRRRSDYIGSWIFAEPRPRLDEHALKHGVDQPCWDPVVLVPDANPTPPQIHRHSAFWPDPRTTALGAYLVDLLTGEPAHSDYYANHGRYEAEEPEPAPDSRKPGRQEPGPRVPEQRPRPPAVDLSDAPMDG